MIYMCVGCITEAHIEWKITLTSLGLFHHSTIRSMIPFVCVVVSSAQRLEISSPPELQIEKSVSWSIWACPANRLSHHAISSLGCGNLDDGLLDVLTCVSKASFGLWLLIMDFYRWTSRWKIFITKNYCLFIMNTFVTKTDINFF